MANCVGCKSSVVPANCIRTEEEFSFEYDSFMDILHKLDSKSEEIKKIMSKKIDKRWITEDREFAVDYIQDLINQIDLLKKMVVTKEEKYKISGVPGENTSLQLFSIIFQKLDQMQNQMNKNSSSLYLI